MNETRSERGASRAIQSWNRNCSICGKTVVIITCFKVSRAANLIGALVSVDGCDDKMPLQVESTSHLLEALMNARKNRESGPASDS